MDYSGQERRRRFVYTTRNTEYYLLDDICVAVRDRRSGRWQQAHFALERRLEGSVRIHHNGAIIPTVEPPDVGDPMYFVLVDDDDQDQVITSRVEAIGRPGSIDLEQYPTAC